MKELMKLIKIVQVIHDVLKDGKVTKAEMIRIIDVIFDK
jgi:hypothetical protein